MVSHLRYWMGLMLLSFDDLEGTSAFSLIWSEYISMVSVEYNKSKVSGISFG